MFRRIVLADASTNSLIFVSNQSSSTPSVVYLGGNKGGDGLIWPVSGLVIKYDRYQLENFIKSNCSVLSSSLSSSAYNDSNADMTTTKPTKPSSLIIEILAPEFMGRLWKFKLNFPVYSNSNTIM